MCRKRFILVTVLLALTALPAFCGFRFDAGFYVLPDLSLGDNKGLPLLPIEIHFQSEPGPLKIGAGLRSMTLIVVTLWCPDVIVELSVGPISFEAHLGGPIIVGTSSLAGGDASMTGLVPELSAWAALDKTFRAGVGGVGIVMLDSKGGFFAFFFGVKYVRGD